MLKNWKQIGLIVSLIVFTFLFVQLTFLSLSIPSERMLGVYSLLFVISFIGLIFFLVKKQEKVFVTLLSLALISVFFLGGLFVGCGSFMWNPRPLDIFRRAFDGPESGVNNIRGESHGDYCRWIYFESSKSIVPKDISHYSKCDPEPFNTLKPLCPVADLFDHTFRVKECLVWKNQMHGDKNYFLTDETGKGHIYMEQGGGI